MHAPAIREKVFAYLRVEQMRAQAVQRFLLIKKRLGVDNPIALARLAEQAPQFARLLHEAAGGDCAAVLEALDSTEHRAWYLSSLGRAGRADELPACFALLAEQPVPENARGLSGTLLLAPGPESAALAARLLPALDEAWPRSLAGRALVLGGRVYVGDQRGGLHRLAVEDPPRDPGQSRAAGVPVSSP